MLNYILYQRLSKLHAYLSIQSANRGIVKWYFSTKEATQYKIYAVKWVTNKTETLIMNKTTNEIIEVRDKKTSLLGYILLFAMFCITLTTGFSVIDEMDNLVKRPVHYSSCLESAYTKNTFGSDSYSCKRLTVSDSSVGHLIKLLKYEDSIKTKFKQISENTNTIRKIRQDLSIYSSVSQAALLAMDKDVFFKAKGSLTTASELYERYDSLRIEIATFKSELENLREFNRPILDNIAAEIANIKIQEDSELLTYNLKVLVLEVILVSLVFFFAFWQWKRLKFRNSPHTIIWSTVVGAQTILLVSVIGGFIWGYIPHRMMKKLMELISTSEILQYLAYLLYMISPILILGTVVWWIQKKLFAPGVVAARRINKGECPGCSFKLYGPEQIHCPRCSQQIRTDCEQCKESTYSDLPHCEKCGKDPHRTQ